MSPVCLCVKVRSKSGACMRVACESCLPRHVAIAISLSDVRSCWCEGEGEIEIKDKDKMR